MSVQATFAATLVDEWARAGLDRAVICPGSRSTPMALAVSADDRFVVNVILDERSAGFFALGLGLASGRPAVLLTTSGTAAVEVHPAVVEAHQARVPLLVVTADRPPELHDVGAPQTTDQVHLYGTALRWSFNPGPARTDSGRFWRSLASRAVAEATVGPVGPGPVHLNLAFDEPLSGQADRLAPGRPAGVPWHQAEAGLLAPPGSLVEELTNGGNRRGLIVAGAGAGDAGTVRAMSQALGWPVLADARSGVREGPGAAEGGSEEDSPVVVAAADALLRHRSFADGHRPDIVLHLGAPWASRVVNTWLDAGSSHHIVIDPHWSWTDPSRVAQELIRCDPGALGTAVVRAVVSAQTDRLGLDWPRAWRRAETVAQGAIDDVLARHREVTEPGVARVLTAGLPAAVSLVVASSMPVRDVEWFGRPGPGGTGPSRVIANRGVNGIDGMISTVFGVSSGAPGPAVGLLGDLAFLHDAGALSGLHEITPPGGRGLVLVVIDNGGGGIFSFLPQAKELERSRFERLFATPPAADVLAVASGYGLAGTEVKDICDLVPGVVELLGSGRPGIIRCHTDRDVNVEVHREFDEAVAAALS